LVQRNSETLFRARRQARPAAPEGADRRREFTSRRLRYPNRCHPGLVPGSNERQSQAKSSSYSLTRTFDAGTSPA